METIQLTILALLANGLGGTTTMNNTLTAGSNITIIDPTASPSLHDSSTLTPTTSGITSTPTTTSGPSSALPSDTSILTTPSISSQYTSKFLTTAQSIPNSTSQPTSYVTNQTTTTKFMTNKSTTIKPTTIKPTTIKPTTIKSTTIKSTTIKSTTKDQDADVPANMIVGCLMGGALLLMVVIIISILVWKRCSNRNSVQDVTWAGTCPVPNGEDSVHVAEDNDIDTAPAKRPSLTTFLSKKSKRESLLGQYEMEVQESEGIINASSPDIEEKLIVPEVKMENEIGNETQALNKTQSQDFPPPPLGSQGHNDNDPHALPPATNTEAPGPPQEVPDVDPNSTNFPPPPLDFLDLVNDLDLPPPLSELQV